MKGRTSLSPTSYFMFGGAHVCGYRFVWDVYSFPISRANCQKVYMQSPGSQSTRSCEVVIRTNSHNPCFVKFFAYDTFQYTFLLLIPSKVFALNTTNVHSHQTSLQDLACNTTQHSCTHPVREEIFAYNFNQHSFTQPLPLSVLYSQHRQPPPCLCL